MYIYVSKKYDYYIIILLFNLSAMRTPPLIYHIRELVLHSIYCVCGECKILKSFIKTFHTPYTYTYIHTYIIQ